MEIVPSPLQSYIKIYDEVMEKNVLNTFLKICKENPNFNDAEIASFEKNKPFFNYIDKKIRDVKKWDLHNINEKNITNVFWANYLCFKFNKCLKEYYNNIESSFLGCSILNIQVLKYEKNGMYNFHVDHGPAVPRTISLIYFLNDDYEGGELCFKFPGNSQELIVEKKANRIIVWPSNFLYPHAVKPVTKGTRYSVVSWAL
tara:strand:+ start:1476 stop:2078 length:603 start_codon:yes stop_codon:yes gene_type:complete